MQKNKDQFFDLNIKEILKDWQISDAIREFISNALDEEKISHCEKFKIYKESDYWIIQDFGRGIQENDFIQNESEEKTNLDFMIGKFGIGLKDAIAVLYRKKVSLEIITNKFIAKSVLKPKADSKFETIHMQITPHSSELQGTKIILAVSDDEIKKAKNNFLRFKEYQPLLENEYGTIIENKNNGEIYFNGLMISQNDDLTFSYNFCKKDKALDKGLNRERKNLGKGVYSNLLRKIFQKIENNKLAKKLSEKLLKDKSRSEEFKIKEIRKFVYSHLNQVVFIDEKNFKKISDEEKRILNNEGKIVIVADGDEKWLSQDQNLKLFWWVNILKKYNQHLQDNLFEVEELDSAKKSQLSILHDIYDQLKSIHNFKLNFAKTDIKISEKLKNIQGTEILGLWNNKEKKLWISEKALEKTSQMIATFFHEIAHSINNDEDLTSEFEKQLTKLTYICAKYISIYEY